MKLLSVDEARKQLKKTPNDASAKVDLVRSLYFRYYEGIDGQQGAPPPQDKRDLTDLDRLLKELPATKAAFYRAVRAIEKGDEKNALKHYQRYWKDEKASRRPYGTYEFIFYLNPFMLENPKPFVDIAAENIERLWPESAATPCARALQSLENDDVYAALDFLTDALVIDDELAYAHYLLADVYYDLKNIRGSICAYEKALEHEFFRQVPYVLFNQGYNYARIDNSDDAIKHYQLCLDLDGDYPFAANNLGYQYLKARNFDEAEKIFRKRLADGKDKNYPYYNLARVYKAQGKFDKAIETLEPLRPKLASYKTLEKQIASIKKLKAKGNTPSPVVDEDDNIGEGAIVARGKQQGENAVPEPLVDGRSPKGYSPREHTLESFLENQIRSGAKLVGRNLVMFEGKEGYGRQLIIPAGRIDLLAVDADTKELVVFELKRGYSSTGVLDQITGYIDWLEAQPQHKKKGVRGVIVLQEPSPSLAKELKDHEQIELYEFQLKLRRA